MMYEWSASDLHSIDSDHAFLISFQILQSEMQFMANAEGLNEFEINFFSITIKEQFISMRNFSFHQTQFSFIRESHWGSMNQERL